MHNITFRLCVVTSNDGGTLQSFQYMHKFRIYHASTNFFHKYIVFFLEILTISVYSTSNIYNYTEVVPNVYDAIDVVVIKSFIHWPSVLNSTHHYIHQKCFQEHLVEQIETLSVHFQPSHLSFLQTFHYILHYLQMKSPIRNLF